jgi:probable rRNA maturation factor
MIIFHFLKKDFSISNRNEIRQWLKEVASSESKELGQIDIIFCSDDDLLEMNKSHLNHDYYTDIITFDYSEKGKMLSGDIYISVDRVKDNASMFEAELFHELLRVIVHGILHLIGYRDTTDEEKLIMRGKEDHYLSVYG